MNSALSLVNFLRIAKPCSVLPLAILLISAPSFAQESSADLGDIDRKLSVLEAKVKRLTDNHAQIISKQSQIKDELDSLRIWIRRNRG